MLEGVKVLDLSHVVAGPYASLYLAMMGAEVIKIENPKTGGDVVRNSGLMVDDFSVRFCSLNHNKKSIVLDLSSEDGKNLFLELVKKADIVIQNLKPGVMDKLGIGYERLKEINPKIVYGSISGFGTYGPYKDLPAYDIVAQSMSGIMWLNGAEGQPPVKIGASLADMVTGINLVAGILAALRKAEKTGVGDFVEVSLVDALISTLQVDFAGYLNSGTLPIRAGNNYRETSPCGVYPAKDGYYGIGVGSEAIFYRLAVNVLNKPELPTDPRFCCETARVKNREALDVFLNEWAGKHTVSEVVDALRAQNIPCAPINTIADVAADEHFAGARNMFPRYEQAGAGNIRITNLPLRFHEEGEPEITSAPRFGEHTQQVMKDELGLDDAQIKALLDRHVIEKA